MNRYLDLVRSDTKKFFSEIAQFNPVPCPACQGPNSRLEFRKIGFQYVSCTDCQTLFANPRPKPDILNKFYTDFPSSRYWINDFFKPMVEARREKVFRPRAESLAARLGKDPKWTVGDIGAGFGLFLSEMKKLWPDSRMIAIEPSPEQATICRGSGLEVIESTIESVSEVQGGFDLLVAFELLEHLYNPRIFVQKVWALLNPGGRLHLTTLNVQGFDIQVLWEKSKAVFPPHHLNFFNPDSLFRLLSDSNFIVEEISTPGRLDYDIVEGMILNEGADTDRFWKLVARKTSAIAKQELQDWITRNRLSSHMSALARKPL